MKERHRDTRRWQAAFGSAPDAYREDMRQALARLEGGEPVKKRMAQTVAIALALVLLLAGVGLAVAHTYGLLDMLGERNTLPEDFADRVQRDVRQEGGVLPGGVRATVREAVTDGVRLFVLVEYSAQNPDDVILMGSDSLEDARERARAGTRSPRWDAIGPEQRVIVVGGVAYSDELYAISAFDWVYQDTSTVLVTYQAEVGELDAVGEAPDQDGLRLTLRPVVFEAGEDGEWVEAGRGLIGMTARRSREPAVSRAAQTPLRLTGGYTVTHLEVLGTELATYVTFEYSVPVDEDGLARDTLYLETLEPDGTPLRLLREYDGDPWKHDPSVNSSVYSFRLTASAVEALPEAVLLRARDIHTDAVLYETQIQLDAPVE